MRLNERVGKCYVLNISRARLHCLYGNTLASGSDDVA